MPAHASPSVLIIGSGFGGIAAAVEFGRHGHRDITILEGADAIGGTWHHNTYPGAACDVPSSLYSFSFARGSGWSRFCAPQPEILAYLRRVATRFGVDRLVQLGQQVQSCDWDEATRLWTATTETGDTFSAQVLVIATGQLHQPLIPAFPGLETFEGKAFHSARWDHDHDLTGQRVAVIGNGASAVQFVPEIVDRVASLTVFQRTGNWFMSRVNKPYTPWRRRIRAIPGVEAIERRGIYHYLEFITASIRRPERTGQLLRAISWLYMRHQLRGRPELREKVWPDYTFGCKRVLFTSHFLKALRRPNADVVTDAITQIVPEGIRTADGAVHEVDVIIHATGFRTTDFMLPTQITANGRSLQETWADGASAHLGITVPGFPSLFLMYGPNTNTSGGSILVFLEAQARYVRTALDHLRATGAAAIEVDPAVAAASDTDLQAQFGGTAWLACNSWYRAEGGRIVTNWPGFMRDYRQATRAIDPAQFTTMAAR